MEKLIASRVKTGPLEEKKNTRIPSNQVAGSSGPASSGKYRRDDRLWSLPVGMAHNLNFWKVKSDWSTLGHMPSYFSVGG